MTAAERLTSTFYFVALPRLLSCRSYLLCSLMADKPIAPTHGSFCVLTYIRIGLSTSAARYCAGTRRLGYNLPHFQSTGTVYRKLCRGAVFRNTVRGYTVIRTKLLLKLRIRGLFVIAGRNTL